MTIVRRALLLDHPQETRFFAFMGAFGVVIAAIYWIISFEVAGTVLLLAFGVGSLVMAARLVLGRPRGVATGPAASEPRARPGPGGGSASGRGTGGVDRPFLDESGRIPGATFAPLAVGLGISLALTSLVLGFWLLVAAVIPLAWGALAWLRAARRELAATERSSSRAATASPDRGD